MRIVKKKRVVRGSAGADSKDDTANAEQPTSKFGATCSVVVKKNQGYFGCCWCCVRAQVHNGKLPRPRTMP